MIRFVPSLLRRATLLLVLAAASAPVLAAAPTDGDINRLLSASRAQSMIDTMLPQIEASQRQMVDQMMAGREMAPAERQRLDQVLGRSSAQQSTGDDERCPFQHGRHGGNLPLAIQLALPLVHPFNQARRHRFGVLGIDALFFARALYLPQPGGAGVPIVDLARQPRPHLAFDLIDFGDPTRAHLGQMLRYE